MAYIRENDARFDRITVQQLRDALDDPRLPESFVVSAVAGYPALAIQTDETDKEDPDGYWYIGYIDLFDGTYHQRRRGERDGINPVDSEAIWVTDPGVTRFGRPRATRMPEEGKHDRPRLVRAIRSLYFGWHYGYPACCIAAFAWWILCGDLPGLRYRLTTADALHGVPFVPCHIHHRRIARGDLRGVEWISAYLKKDAA